MSPGSEGNGFRGIRANGMILAVAVRPVGGAAVDLVCAVLRFAQRSGYRDGINRAVERFEDGGCGYRDRIAVSVAEGANNFLRRSKPLANLRRQGPDSLRNGL